jgi:hypothetical protein
MEGTVVFFGVRAGNDVLLIQAVRDKVAGKGQGQQQRYWTEAVQVINTDDRPDLSSEGAPDIDKTVNVKQKLISGHEPQMGLDTKTDWSTDRQS